MVCEPDTTYTSQEVASRERRLRYTCKSSCDGIQIYQGATGSTAHVHFSEFEIFGKCHHNYDDELKRCLSRIQYSNEKLTYAGERSPGKIDESTMNRGSAGHDVEKMNDGDKTTLNHSNGSGQHIFVTLDGPTYIGYARIYSRVTN